MNDAENPQDRLDAACALLKRAQHWYWNGDETGCPLDDEIDAFLLREAYLRKSVAFYRTDLGPESVAILEASIAARRYNQTPRQDTDTGTIDRPAE